MKPKVAFFDFASCEGCQLTVLNCEDIFLDLLNLVEIVEFREAISEKAPRYDVAFIEGSIHRNEDRLRILDIRQRSKYLVAMGACACNGNVQARSNDLSPMQNLEAVYGAGVKENLQSSCEHHPLWRHQKVHPLSDIVKVDFYLRGCPIDYREFVALVKSLIQGKDFVVPQNPVCVECKMNENECTLNKKEACLGPITWGGCNAVCINNGWTCDGCRGFLPAANLRAHKNLLKEKGYSESEIMSRYKIHCAGQPQMKGLSS